MNLSRSLLALAVLAAGCAVKTPATAPKKSSAPVPVASSGPGVLASTAPVPQAGPLTVPQTGQATSLIGKVKLLSDHGAGIISNNSGSIIANNGGGLVSNNGGSYALLDAGGLREAALADAVLHLYDGNGRQLVDEHGQPLAATSDAQGGYSFKAVLPAGNLVLRAELHNGGELKGGQLAAMVVPNGQAELQLPLDTATSLGAAYVLGQYVKGDQQVYNRLPAVLGERLRLELAAASSRLTSVPSYQADALSTVTDGLRKQLQPVDKALSDIQVALLGQADLGGGKLATQVPLSAVKGVAIDDQGTLYVGESSLGRIRAVAPDGKLTTYADANFGTVKENFNALEQLLHAPDGSLWVRTAGSVERITPDGKRVHVAGTGLQLPVTDGTPAASTPIWTSGLAVGADGTAYITEQLLEEESFDDCSPRLVTVGADGITHVEDFKGRLGKGKLAAAAMGPDGMLDLLLWPPGRPGELYRYKPGSGVAPTKVAVVAASGTSSLTHAPDGSVYVVEALGPRLLKVAPDGTVTAIAGRDTSDGAVLTFPIQLAVLPDGSLAVADLGRSLVLKRSPAGQWSTLAGLESASQSGSGGDIAVNQPIAVAYDDQQRLIVVENGTYRLEAYDGKTFQTIAGNGTRGYTGDGGPATQASFNGPTAVVARNGELWVLESNNDTIRHVDRAGMISSLLGNQGTLADPTTLKPGHPVPARTWTPLNASAMAMSPDGRLYWTDSSNGAIERLSADGSQVELVAGLPGTLDFGTVLVPVDGPAADARFGTPLGLAFDPQGNLYVADGAGACVRKITGLSTATPTITTIAGVGTTATIERLGGEPRDEEGIDAKDATIVGPAGLCLDPAGNLYVGELGTANAGRLTALPGGLTGLKLFGLPPSPARVRKITPDGKISTVAGPGGLYFPDPNADDALIVPAGLTVSPDGKLVVVDGGANQIRFLAAGSY